MTHILQGLPALLLDQPTRHELHNRPTRNNLEQIHPLDDVIAQNIQLLAMSLRHPLLDLFSRTIFPERAKHRGGLVRGSEVGCPPPSFAYEIDSGGGYALKVNGAKGRGLTDGERGGGDDDDDEERERQARKSHASNEKTANAIEITRKVRTASNVGPEVEIPKVQ